MFDYLARALDISLNIQFEHLDILLKTNNASVSLLMYASESDYFSCGDCYFIFSIVWIVNFFSSTLDSCLTPFYLLSRQISNRQRWHSSHDYIGSTRKQSFQPQSQGERNR